MLSRIERVSATEAVVDQMISLIRRGDLRPGDKLPSEFELMEMLGVGRSTLREAKQVLISLGLIEAYPGRGSFVMELGPDDAINQEIVALLIADEHIMALYEARALLEVQISALAAARATEDDLTELELALEALAQAVAAGESVYDLAMEFHLALVKAAHNPVLVTLYQPIATLLQEHQRPLYERLSDPAVELCQHQEILASIRQRDSALAQATMRRHLDYVMNTTQQAAPEAVEQQQVAVSNTR
jgi:GntR family transcriptional repressor for pyruvate dehydrogenase complex